MPGGVVSIKEIAERAGTSVATVSRVINQNGRFSKETEERVRRVIEEFDYHPNNVARALRQDRMRVIGVVLPDITSAYFAGIARSIEETLLDRGYMAVLCDTGEKEQIEAQYINMLTAMRATGIIYISERQTTTRLDVPVVYVDRRPGNGSMSPGSCFIGSDNRRGGYLAAERLIAAGRRSLAVVMHRKELDTQRDRYEGFCRAMRENGVGGGQPQIWAADEVDYQNGFSVTEKILAAPQIPDGIFYSSDVLAIGGVHCLDYHGIPVPGRISVIGMDNIPLGEQIRPKLTTVNQQYERFGRLAASSILDIIENGTVAENKILDVTIVERESV